MRTIEVIIGQDGSLARRFLDPKTPQRFRQQPQREGIGRQYQ